VVNNQSVITGGPRKPQLLQDVWFFEKLAHFDRKVIPEHRIHAKVSGAYGTFTVTHNITKYTQAKIFSKVDKKTDLFMRFSIVAGERGAADAELDIRGFGVTFYNEQGKMDLAGNNTLVFLLRNPLKFPVLNHAVKHDPHTNLRSARIPHMVKGWLMHGEYLKRSRCLILKHPHAAGEHPALVPA
jgi:catalase